MAHSDGIADLLTRLRNGVKAKRRFVDSRTSRTKVDIVKVLERKGFIESVLIDTDKRRMRIFLKYAEGRDPVLQGLKRSSSPGMRQYIGSQEIPRIYGGIGMAILSTSKGVLDGETARRENVGGELLCYVW
jgi:small subunit ribosomal protein S8